MTSLWTWLLVAIAVVVWNLSSSLPRSRMWILAGGADFFLTTIYYDLGMPRHPVFTLLCDATVCLSVYFLAEEEWEMRIFNVFQMSVLLSLLRVWGVYTDSELYATLLELCNLAALLYIGGTAIRDRASGPLGRADPGWLRHRLSASRASLRRTRKTPAFHKVRR